MNSIELATKMFKARNDKGVCTVDERYRIAFNAKYKRVKYSSMSYPETTQHPLIFDHVVVVSKDGMVYTFSEVYCNFNQMSMEEIYASTEIMDIVALGWKIVLISKELSAWSPNNSVLVIACRKKIKSTRRRIL